MHVTPEERGAGYTLLLKRRGMVHVTPWLGTDAKQHDNNAHHSELCHAVNKKKLYLVKIGRRILRDEMLNIMLKLSKALMYFIFVLITSTNSKQLSGSAV